MQQELLELAQRFGRPYENTQNLGSNSYLAISRTRIAEVCLVYQRPSGKFLTITKPFYPAGIYRLPTGSILPGESVLEALERESWQETGLQAQILRYLAHITYQHNEGRLFHSYVFLLAAESTPRPQDHLEQISNFREVSAPGLLEIALNLEGLPPHFSKELGATWADWGKFRAVVHQVAAQALTQHQAI
ncbi:NUDIX domain-containing protein [Meiothermus hypogaeus]|uniref:NUDIX hydrolase n=2 Tax=Meiothermus hypogaeus TaxID=884155 RepID=A0A511R5W8_9DEIN|nr:NUDIX hydrolase [Meiothermus hypogaeus]RIH77212.1 Phosphatase NudJ [Meiothermus hypogaeus]GEM84637.1 NUDIX hydrolase [Meiothermus hypogaeus NBRC 106114]